MATSVSEDVMEQNTSEEESRNTQQINEQADEENMSALVTAEEYLELNKTALQMLPFQKQMFLDLITSDGLLVCAKGINYNNVIVNLLAIHSVPENLILVINCADFEEKFFKSHLIKDHIHESSTNAAEREAKYLLGGIHFLTTRILVVDLLKRRIPIELVTGIVVLRAHQIVESCQEAFALRLYRQSNKTGFIKAFSSYPEAFTYGYGHVEKVMRNLFVRELFIWPRFHATMQQSLKPYEPQIIELHIPMTQRMTQIQNNILDIMNLQVKELKRLNRFVDLQEITVENCLTKRFHKILQAQLDCIWHQLSANTKQIITELKVLRSLMISTIYSDSVSLYVLMKKYRSQTYANSNSGWVLSDSAEKMFKASRERVFNDADEFDPEPSPKWKALLEILSVEIPADIKRSVDYHPNALSNPIKVLVLCQDSRTCYQLNQYLTQGYERFLLFTAMKNDLPISKISERFTKIRDEAIAGGVVLIRAADGFTAPIPPKGAVAKAAAKSLLTNTTSEISASSVSTNSQATARSSFLRDRIARRKELEEAEFGKEEIENTVDKGSQSTDEIAALANDEHCDIGLFRESYVLTMTQTLDSNDTTTDSDSFDFTQMTYASFAEMENLEITQLLNTTTEPLVCIQTFKTGEDGMLSLERTLEEMSPGYVIMYHCNISAIRQIEVYESHQKRSARDRLKVFFLMHSQTVEEQSYLTNLRREKLAFDLLIDTKAKMVVPEYQDGKSDDSMLMLKKKAASTCDELHPLEERLANEITPKIIVDMREFRSDLPCLIHKRGLEIVPVTIAIGDYILTPEICVERKSISDLIGSLNSGRLYNQCVQMTRSYKKPILLIEFDQNKAFHLQGHYMLSGDSDGNSSNVDITKKLQLLTLCFPKLRLVWSPSPYATAQLFEEIKQNREEPIPKDAAAKGSDSTTKELMDNIIDKINPSVHDFLMRLPGVTSRNIGLLLKKVKDLKHLLRLTEEELSAVLGSQSNARLLYDICHGTHKPVLPVNEKTKYPSKFKRGAGRRF